MDRSQSRPGQLDHVTSVGDGRQTFMTWFRLRTMAQFVFITELVSQLDHRQRTEIPDVFLKDTGARIAPRSGSLILGVWSGGGIGG